MQLSIWCNNNFKHLNVIIWCEWHVQVYAIFIKSWQENYETFVTVVERKKGATSTITKWCHGNVSVPVTRLRYRCKGEVCRCVQKMVGCSRIPGVPRVDGMEARDTTDTVQIKGASHTTQAIVLGRSFRGYTFEECVLGRFRFDGMSTEVDVHGS